MENFIQIAKNAKTASLEIADISTELKNAALLKIADAISNDRELIFEANKKDLSEAENSLNQASFPNLLLTV